MKQPAKQAASQRSRSDLGTFTLEPLLPAISHNIKKNTNLSVILSRTSCTYLYVCVKCFPAAIQFRYSTNLASIQGAEKHQLNARKRVRSERSASVANLPNSGLDNDHATTCYRCPW